MEQLALTLPHQPSLEAADLWIGDCNVQAVEWLNAWGSSPEFSASPGLVIYGETGSGKTHLMHVWQSKVGAAWLASRDDIEDFIALGADLPAIVDDAPQFDEDILFHLYNYVKNNGLRGVFTAARPPRQWEIALKDWRSRVLSLPSVEIRPPDEETLAAVLLKQAADRQLVLDEAVLAYMLPRIPRSFAAIQDVIEALDQASLSQKRAITVPLAKGVLAYLEKS